MSVCVDEELQAMVYWNTTNTLEAMSVFVALFMEQHSRGVSMAGMVTAAHGLAQCQYPHHF